MTAHLEAERSGWYELAELVRSLTPEECVTPGYYRDPDWAVRDLVSHLGTWLAEAENQFERMHAGTYEGHDIDVDALNARLLAAMEGQPWEVAWVQANAGRTRMLDEWPHLEERDRRGHLVDPEVRRRSLRRPYRAPPGVGGGADRAPRLRRLPRESTGP